VKRKRNRVPHSEKRKEKGLLYLRKKIYVCESKKKIREIFFFFSCETYTKIIVIDLIIVKLFRVCPLVFPFKRKGFPR